MPRKRMIDPGIWQSEDFGRLSALAKIVFIGLFSNADDGGRGRARAAYIKSVLFPYDEGMRVADVDKVLSEIAHNMSVTFYLHNENEYYSLDKWKKWQMINKPTESRLPALDEASTIIRRAPDKDPGSAHGIPYEGSGSSTVALPEGSGSSTVALPEDYRLIEVKGKEVKGREENEGAVAPPSPAVENISKPRTQRRGYGVYGWVKLSCDEFTRLNADYGEDVVSRFIGVVDEYAQQSGNKGKYKDWNVVVRKAIREKWGVSREEQERETAAVREEERRRRLNEYAASLPKGGAD